MADDGIPELLRLAGLRPSDKEAAAWLSNAVEGLKRPDDKAPQKKPLPADHNALLTDIEKSAKELIERLERLRNNRFSQTAFWHSRVFGRYPMIELRSARCYPPLKKS